MLDLKIILNICKPVLESTTILLPSGEEAEMLAGIEGEKEACRKLLEMGPELVVLKQGKRGSMIFSKDQKHEIQIPGYNADEIDPTGAGDSFGGAFVVAYLNEWDLLKAARFANAVGALKVQSFGPMPKTSYEQVLTFMEN